MTTEINHCSPWVLNPLPKSKDATPHLQILIDLSGPEFMALRKTGFVEKTFDRRSIPADIKPEKIVANMAAHQPFILEAARKYNLDPSILTAVMINESGGRADAMSGTGAYGTMQLTRWIYGASKDLGPAINPFRPEEAIDRAALFLSKMRDRYGGDLDKMMAGYNQGEPAVNRAMAAAKKYGGDWKSHFMLEAPTNRHEGLKYVKSIRNILNLSDGRVSSALHPLLCEGSNLARSNHGTRHEVPLLDLVELMDMEMGLLTGALKI